MRELTNKKVKMLEKKASKEIDREIHYIYIEDEKIRINGDWEISISEEKDIDEKVVEAIELYSTKKNLEWEVSATYSMWCE